MLVVKVLDNELEDDPEEIEVADIAQEDDQEKVEVEDIEVKDNPEEVEVADIEFFFGRLVFLMQVFFLIGKNVGDCSFLLYCCIVVQVQDKVQTNWFGFAQHQLSNEEYVPDVHHFLTAKHFFPVKLGFGVLQHLVAIHSSVQIAPCNLEFL